MDQLFVFGAAYGLNAIRSLEFTSPLLFLVSVVLLLAFVLAGYRKRRGREVGFTDTAELYKKAEKKAARIDLVKNIALVIIISVLGLVWAGPVVSESVVKTEERVDYLRTTILVIDISGSMKQEMDTSSDDERSSFQAVRDASISYLEQNKNNTRVGVIFFSDGFVEWRRPTKNIEGLIEDLKMMDLVLYDRAEGVDYPGWMSNQMRLVSRGTNTPPALYRAEQTIYELSLKENIESASVILFSDLGDKKEELIQTFNDLSSNKIKLYILFSGARGVIGKITPHFEENDMVKFYNVASPKDIKDAYADISRIEAKPIRVLERYEEQKSTKTEAVLALFVLVVLFVLFTETYGHTVKGGGR